MGDLMAYHRAGAAKVNGIVHVGVKVRRLQNAGREIDGVELGIVIGVDGGRSHGPLATIHRLANLVQPAMKFEVSGLTDILQETPASYFHGGVIAPAVGIADLVFDPFQLHFGLLLGLWRHPINLLNVVAERTLDGVHHLQRPLLAGGRESAVNIGLAQSLAQVAIDEVHAAPPARLQRLCASQSMAEEIEIFFLEIRAQIARRAMQHPPAQVCLPVLQRMLLQHLFQAAKIIR